MALAAAQAAQGNVAGSFSGKRNTPSEVLQERSVASAAAEQCWGELQERSAAPAAAAAEQYAVAPASAAETSPVSLARAFCML